MNPGQFLRREHGPHRAAFTVESEPIPMVMTRSCFGRQKRICQRAMFSRQNRWLNSLTGHPIAAILPYKAMWIVWRWCTVYSVGATTFLAVAANWWRVIFTEKNGREPPQYRQQFGPLTAKSGCFCSNRNKTVRKLTWLHGVLPTIALKQSPRTSIAALRPICFIQRPVGALMGGRFCQQCSISRLAIA